MVHYRCVIVGIVLQVSSSYSVLENGYDHMILLNVIYIPLSEHFILKKPFIEWYCDFINIIIA